MPTKESRELYLAERFLPELFKEQQYTLLQPAPPLSDIVINAGNKRVGIEITALILDEQAKRRESEQDAILREAQILFEKKHQLPLHVSISFNESANWKQLDRRQIADFLANTIIDSVSEIRNLPQYQATFTIRLNNVINSYVQSITVFYLQQITNSCWSPITSFWVPKLPIEKIQKVINRKNKNISGYLQGCDEVWLLILETGSPSSYFDRFDTLKEITFASNFARTLIGRISRGELLTLQTEPQIQ